MRLLILTAGLLFCSQMSALALDAPQAPPPPSSVPLPGAVYNGWIIQYEKNSPAKSSNLAIGLSKIIGPLEISAYGSKSGSYGFGLGSRIDTINIGVAYINQDSISIVKVQVYGQW